MAMNMRIDGGSIPPIATTVLTIKSGRSAKSIPEPLSAKAWIEGINKAERTEPRDGLQHESWLTGKYISGFAPSPISRGHFSLKISNTMMTDKQALAFMQKVDANAPFWVELHDEDRPTMNINGNDVPRCLYNLMLTKRDIRLYADLDMKPHRSWKISDVKKYFGLKGGKQKVKDAIFTIHDEFIGRIENQDDDNT